MDAKSSNHKRIFSQLCNFCSGDHWNDNCPTYATVEERKQILKRLGCCYVCLKRGHRAFECLTKKTFYFCKKETYHHTSICHQNGNNYYVPFSKSNLQNKANNEPVSEETETLCYRTHINVCEFIKYFMNCIRSKPIWKIPKRKM